MTFVPTQIQSKILKDKTLLSLFKSIAVTQSDLIAENFTMESMKTLVIGPTKVFFKGTVFSTTRTLEYKIIQDTEEFKNWLNKSLSRYDFKGRYYQS